MAITTKQIKSAFAQPETTEEEWEARMAEYRAERAAARAANKGKPPHFDDRGYFVFSSGRSTACHADIFSVSEDGEVSYGHDGGVRWPPSDRDDGRDTEDDLTADDMRELADMMIARWQKFRKAL